MTALIHIYNMENDTNILSLYTKKIVILRHNPDKYSILRPRKNERHFVIDISKLVFFNQTRCILILISLKIVPQGWTANKSILVQVMA